MESVVRVLYYLGFLLVIGWVIWWKIIQLYSAKVRSHFVKWGLVFQIIHLLGLILITLQDTGIILNGEFSFYSTAIFHLPIGPFWLISLLIALLGFFLLFKNQWFDLCWVLTLIVCKSLNGHPLNYEPVFYLTLFNSFHLIAATIWVAGLTFIVLFWHKFRNVVINFIPIFSEYAFICMVMMAISGSILAYQYVPRIDFFFQPWGLVLLVKLMFVSIITWIAYKIRFFMKNEHMKKIGFWLHVEFLFMVIIICLVAILTNINPIFTEFFTMNKN